MRLAVLSALVFLSACAGQQLALAPPAGVDFTGKWRLNENDSDDPQHLVQSQNPGSVTNAGGTNGQGSPGGQGRGGRQGRGGGGGFGGGVGGPGGPSMPPIGELGEGLRWPGKNLEVKQVGGVVAITSAGDKRVYRPSAARKHSHRPPSDDGPEGRDMPAERGEGPPPRSGWEDKTLVVQTHDPDDGSRFDQRYSISDDGQRLIEVVSFQGGRSSGYTVSRVWDRDVPGASQPDTVPAVPPPPAAPPPPGSQRN